MCQELKVDQDQVTARLLNIMVSSYCSISVVAATIQGLDANLQSPQQSWDPHPNRIASPATAPPLLLVIIQVALADAWPRMARTVVTIGGGPSQLWPLPHGMPLR